jgi:GTP cyclohydrolase I
MHLVEVATRKVLSAFELPLQDPSIKDTPKRVARMWEELLGGYAEDPAKILCVQFPLTGYDQMVVLRNIAFHSTCEHHMLPFAGIAAVGYIPSKDGGVVGLSKLARVVECFARRLQLQERMTDQIASAIQDALKPRGVGVLVRATHQCMVCRGVKKPGAEMVTSALRGEMLTTPEARAEFLAMAD